MWSLKEDTGEPVCRMEMNSQALKNLWLPGVSVEWGGVACRAWLRRGHRKPGSRRAEVTVSVVAATKKGMMSLSEEPGWAPALGGHAEGCAL